MRTKSTGGFTLIELLIVIAIIGILAAVLIPNLMNARRVAVDRAAQGYVQNIYTAANAYMAENVRATPETVVGLLTNGSCASGVTFDSYGVAEPSFGLAASDPCTVAVSTTNDIMITLNYDGGTEDQIIFPEGSIATTE